MPFKIEMKEWRKQPLDSTKPHASKFRDTYVTMREGIGNRPILIIGDDEFNITLTGAVLSDIFEALCSRKEWGQHIRPKMLPLIKEAFANQWRPEI